MRNRHAALAATAVLVLFFVMASAATLSAEKKNISTDEANELIEQHDGDQDFVILDVRSPEEFSEGYIENAVNMDFYAVAFPDELEDLDRDKTYLVYCRSGNRSGMTFKMMKKLGFRNVYNIKGGITAWSDSYSVVK